MAYEMRVDICDEDGGISVTHSFWGMTAKEAEAAMAAHLVQDKALAAAQDEGRTIEELEEIDDDDLPEAEEGEEEVEES